MTYVATMSPGSSVVERLQARTLAGVLALPASVRRCLTGPPARADGDPLALDVHTALWLMRVTREPAAEGLPLAEGRLRLARQIRALAGDEPIGEVRRLTVAGADGPLPARLYVPTVDSGSTTDSAPGPLCVYFHGGGFLFGDLDTHEQTCRFLAEQAGCRVLSVDYRLAPERKHPTQSLDCAAAYRWVVRHAADLGADPARLAVGGDSAGGFLAAATAITAAQEGLPCAFQLLIYPLSDSRGGTRSRDLFGEGYILTTQFMDLAEQAWLEPGQDLADPAISLVLRDFSGDLPADLAPAYVATAGFDPLRDEGEAYARLLAGAGVEVLTQRFGDQIHGFVNTIGVPSSRRATHHVAAALEAGLGGSVSPG